jgi:hypothetical protein
MLTTTYQLDAEQHSITLDRTLAGLVQTHNPYNKEEFKKRVSPQLKKPVKLPLATLSREKLTELAHHYGEQYVEDPCADLDQFFDIINNRWPPRLLQTRSVQHFLFGPPGKVYHANISALCTCGEGVAGYVMENLGYTPFVRPLGIMPDLLSFNRSHYAFTEAKATTKDDPQGLRDKHLYQFLVDVKTRSGFRYAYEAYLICTRFSDGGIIHSDILHVDLASISGTAAPSVGAQAPLLPPDDKPSQRVDTYLRLGAITANDGDTYLTELLHDEATRAAVLALLVEQSGSPDIGQVDKYLDEVDKYLDKRMRDLDISPDWGNTYDQPELRQRRHGIVAAAVKQLRSCGSARSSGSECCLGASKCKSKSRFVRRHQQEVGTSVFDRQCLIPTPLLDCQHPLTGHSSMLQY